MKTIYNLGAWSSGYDSLIQADPSIINVYFVMMTIFIKSRLIF